MLLSLLSLLLLFLLVLLLFLYSQSLLLLLLFTSLVLFSPAPLHLSNFTAISCKFRDFIGYHQVDFRIYLLRKPSRTLTHCLGEAPRMRLETTIAACDELVQRNSLMNEWIYLHIYMYIYIHMCIYIYIYIHIYI